MKIKFKVIDGRLVINDKRYQEMNYTERSLFGTLINYKKQQFNEQKNKVFVA